MKHRLKKVANNVDPYINLEVEYRVKNPDGSVSEEKSEEFLLAKRLFACTPFTPVNSIIYQFTERIRNGDYDNICCIEDADNNWDIWLDILNNFLNEIKVVDSDFFRIKTAGPNNLYTDSYTDKLYTNDYLDMNKDLNKDKQNVVPSEKEDFISNSYSIAKDLINALPIVPRYDLMSQIAQDIERGDFEDISPVGEAKNNWEAWVARARKILQFRNIILSSKNRLKRSNKN